MDNKTKKMFEEVQKLLDCSCQSWLFGAGISFESKIPLMFQLTERVEKLINDKGTDEQKGLYSAIKNQLSTSAHIEYYLSQIGDLIALIDRTNKLELEIDSIVFTSEKLFQLYLKIIEFIGDTVRYGYYKSSTGVEEIGTKDDPIVNIENHRKFAKAIARIRKEKLSKNYYFTTNYDTLLEDALALEGIECQDGFLGTSTGFWKPEKAFEQRSERIIDKVFKLHGSVDWYSDERKEVIRCSHGATYISGKHNLLIYPQATKYIETQKDPFAYLFAKFRESFEQSSNNILIVNGYSFGDNHVNSEIENAMLKQGNMTTVIIFIKEKVTAEGENELPQILNDWTTDKRINERIHILTNRGIYNGDQKSVLPSGDIDYSWWTFSGMIDQVLLGGTLI